MVPFTDLKVVPFEGSEGSIVSAFVAPDCETTQKLPETLHFPIIFLSFSYDFKEDHCIRPSFAPDSSRR